jgi:3D (Asp-Asp-Asp) domain-containing protein
MVLLANLMGAGEINKNKAPVITAEKEIPTVINVIVPKKTIRRVSCTAYYAPLPKQKKYALGNYSRDVRMNGRGVETSSGTKPEIGTIAADPAHYKRGTLLIVPGYGIGVVEDTGSVIKGKKRLDLFMGKGDDGLESALDWGCKTLDIQEAEIVKVAIERK